MASAVGLGELQASVRSGKAGGGRAATAAPAGMRVKKGHLKVKPADAAGPSSGSKRKICEAMCNSVQGATKDPGPDPVHRLGISQWRWLHSEKFLSFVILPPFGVFFAGPLWARRALSGPGGSLGPEGPSQPRPIVR